MSFGPSFCDIDYPFMKHRLHTKSDVSLYDVRKILLPLLSKENIVPSYEEPDTIMFQIGEKIISLTVKDYQSDKNLEVYRRFADGEVHIKRTIHIDNHCSIKGTEILVDFLKAFQKQYPVSYFEICNGAYVYPEDMATLRIHKDLLDPDLADIKEDEELFLELNNE